MAVLVKPSGYDHKGNKTIWEMGDLDKLRDLTNVGDYITFNKKVTKAKGDGDVNVVLDVAGHVLKKYPYTFLLSDGRIYQWKEYLIGQK